MSNDLYLGDCREVRSVLPDNSIDTIITDPPYGLEFMGKGWDKGVPGVEFWKEFLTVTKPGGFLLAFGGTRTFHRMTVAIEDAGWEIRDCMMYLYGSGFPKSHNFGCKCGGKDGKPSPESDVRSVPESNVSQTVDATDKCGKVLQSGLPEQGPSSFRAEGTESQITGGQQSRMEGRGNILEQTRQLSPDQVCAMPDSVSTDGAKGRIHNGTSALDGPTDKAATTEGGGGASPKPQSTGQSARKSRTTSKQQKPQVSRMGTCLACGGLRDWRGYGTALKPSFEPIIVAMKPLDGTFAANAERHGVAGLNVDGGRIGLSGGTRKAGPPSYVAGNSLHGSLDGSLNGGGCEDIGKGRWPANLLLDEEAGKLLDEQSGQSSSNYRKDKGMATGLFPGKHRTGHGVADSGGASRFFYCAKASKSERNEGCEETMTWEGLDQSSSTESIKLLVKDISGDILSLMANPQWSIELYGSLPMGISQADLIFTTSTISKLITDLKTCSSSQNSTISVYTQDALRALTARGISLVGCAELFEKLKFGTTNEKTGLALGASLVALKTLSAISASAKRGNVHSTVKPLKLMEYLCTLTKTPTGGVVLDPFAGSGTTLLAAKNTGREYIGIEQNPDYYEIIKARLGLK